MVQLRNWGEFLDSGRLSAFQANRLQTNGRFFLYNYVALALAVLLLLTSVVGFAPSFALVLAGAACVGHAGCHQPSLDNMAFSAATNLRDRVDQKINRALDKVDRALKSNTPKF